MCGITGYISSSAHILVSDFYRAHRLIRHRGPDDEGFVMLNQGRQFHSYRGDETIDHFRKLPHLLTESTTNFIFGHRRLSILDITSKGHQPFLSDDGNYVITYNGEVYNYKNLRDELECKGYHFHSDSDTEVVLYSYVEWGKGCFAKFNGMWALAIYDKKKDEIILSRDRFGIKPLYYTITGNGSFCFGSELKFIRALDTSLDVINKNVVRNYLQSCFLNNTEETFFCNIKELEPAHLLTLSKGRIEIEKYWSFTPQQTITDINEAVERFSLLFEDSVKQYIQSDVEVGALLSGGLDSNLIVGVMSKLGCKPQCFSAVFEDERFSEKKYIDESVQYYNLNAHYIYPNPTDFLKDSYDMMYHMEEPFRSLSAYSGFYIYKYMQMQTASVKVVLNGQGADELFGGYTNDYFVFFAELLLQGRISKFFREVHLFSKRRRIPFSLICRHILRACLFNNNFPEHCLSGITKTPLREYLRYEDRNSMAFGIEARVPFLDYRIVEFALSLSTSLKIDNFINKRIERISAAGTVVDYIINREDKMGFVSPQEMWQQTDLKRAFDEVFLTKKLSAITSMPIDPLLKEYDNYCSGKNENWGKIWRIYCLYKWEEML